MTGHEDTVAIIGEDFQQMKMKIFVTANPPTIDFNDNLNTQQGSQRRKAERGGGSDSEIQRMRT